MKLKKITFMSILASASFFLLGGALFYSIEARHSLLDNAQKFHHQYLLTSQHALDLGKNLNAYGDFLYGEIKSFRNRDSLFYKSKIKSSFDLLFSKKLFSLEKEKELRDSLGELLKRSNLILQHLKSGESELARRIYEKEFREDLKSFSMNLDSHKKLLQNKANLYFAKHVASSGSLERQTTLAWAGALFVLSGFSFFGLYWRWKIKENILLAQRRELALKVDALADESFAKKETLQKLKDQLLKAVRESDEFPAASLGSAAVNAPVRSPSDLEFQKSVEQALACQERFSAASRARFDLAKKEIEDFDRLWLKAKERFSNLSKLKMAMINSALKNSGSFAGAFAGPFAGEDAGALGLIEDLETIFKQDPPGFIKSETSRECSLWEGKTREALSRSESLGKALVEDIKKAAFTTQDAQKKSLESIAAIQKNLELAFLQRRERLVKALVLIDGEQEEAGLEKNSKDQRKAA